MYSLHNGDALEWMKSLPAASVDCVFVDLPYFGVVADDWDNQWKDRNEYLDWVVSLAHEWKRITKSNSSIFLFCDEKMEAYIQVRLDEYFLLLNKIVWFKKNSLAKSATETFRSFAPTTERALFYAKPESDQIAKGEIGEHFFIPIREILMKEKGNKSLDDLSKISGLPVSQISHYFRRDANGWRLPDQETINKLCFNLSEVELRNQYEFLKRDYEIKRRPFNADNKTFDVIEWANVNANDNTDHPTTKPLGLYRRILSVITTEGQTVVDCCMGSGTAGVASLELGRHFLGCDNDPKYFSIAQARIKKAAQSPSFYTLPNNRLHLDVGDSPAQQALFTPEADTAEGKLPAPAPRR